MNWNDLLSKERLGDEIEIPYDENQYVMSEFEKDYWRILDCSAFRRLQDKTQVFPLDKSGYNKLHCSFYLFYFSVYTHIHNYQEKN